MYLLTLITELFLRFTYQVEIFFIILFPLILSSLLSFPFLTQCNGGRCEGLCRQVGKDIDGYMWLL